VQAIGSDRKGKVSLTYLAALACSYLVPWISIALILDESERHPSPPEWEIVIKRPAARARPCAARAA
jgi:hypothetical protein